MSAGDFVPHLRTTAAPGLELHAQYHARPARSWWAEVAEGGAAFTEAARVAHARMQRAPVKLPDLPVVRERRR